MIVTLHMRSFLKTKLSEEQTYFHRPAFSICSYS